MSQNKKRGRVGANMKPRANQAEKAETMITSEESVSTTEVRDQAGLEPESEAPKTPETPHDPPPENSPIIGQTPVAAGEQIETSSTIPEEAKRLHKLLEESNEAATEAGLESAEVEGIKAGLADVVAGRIRPLKEVQRELESKSPRIHFNADEAGGLGYYAGIDTALGEQADGTFKVILTINEGYAEPCRQEAEANGKTLEEWVSEQFGFFLESWWRPPQKR